jgi:hypothetical protein
VYFFKQKNLEKIVFVGVLKVNDENKKQEPNLHPNPLVRGMDPQIRIHTKYHGFGTCVRVLYYYGASTVLHLATVCGEIRQPFDAKMRQ